MIFSSLEFVLFAFVLLIFYFSILKKFQWLVLLLGSVMFFGYLSISSLVYVSVYTLLNYGFGIYLHNQKKVTLRKAIYYLAIILNIGQLAFFKYVNFLIGNFVGLVNAFDFTFSFEALDLIIPIGISYYTFQSIGYIIDINRKTIPAERHLGYFAVYMMFFPKILAGPIERPKKFLSQFSKVKEFDPVEFKESILLIFWGFFKKLVIADRLVVLVNSVNAMPEQYSGITLFITFLLQVIHLYCDFSGYTDIALGVSRLFRIELTDNFNRPLFAENVSMFWRRWHISLSNWCNDYIFKKILLKRLKWKKWASVYGVFITFFIIGIWHGDRWTFIVLGILQGIAINYEFFTKRARLKLANKLPQPFVKVSSRLFTYLFVCVTILLFYSHNMQNAVYFISHLLSNWSTIEIFDVMDRYDVIIVASGIFIVFFVDYMHEKQIEIRKQLLPFKALRHSVFYFLIFFVLFFGKLESSEFIYFNF